MPGRGHPVLRDLRRRVEGYLAFMTKWGNSRIGRPDLHPPADTARYITEHPPRIQGKGDKTG